MTSKKIVIFDMDGVLFDTIGFARESFLKRRPSMTKEMYNELHSGNYHEEARKYDHLKVRMSEDEEKKYLVEYAQKKSESKMFEGMKDLLNELHDEKYTLVLNTNAYERNCLPLLRNAGIKDLFDFMAWAEVSKDKVEKFKIIERKFNSKKENTVFITDALGDIRDAERANVKTIAVTFGVHGRTHFKGAHPYLIGIVDTSKELSQLLHLYFAR